jgi:Na+/H+-dicarboxylate symporter
MKFSLGLQVIFAVVLGIIVGLVVGPYCSIFNPIGEVFFMLLQMVVLPYLLFLLIHGLGSLSPAIGKKLFSRGWVFFLVLWVIGAAVVFALLTLIPISQLIFEAPIASGREMLRIDILSYLIPKNVFYDLANNVVPAIVICGLIGGLSVMTIQNKSNLLTLLSQVNASIEKILEWLAKLSPIAIFSHIAVASGTMHFENLAKVEFFVAVFIAATLFLTLWVLPVLLTSMTDLRYRDVMREFRLVCLIPFATAMPSLAIPFIYQTIKRHALSKSLQEMDNYDNTAQTVLPLTYTFGQLGNFFILFFVYFLAFYTHHALSSGQEILLMILLLPMSFGTVISGISSISFLLDKFHFPQNAYAIFWTTSSITLNFQVLLSVASILTLIILILSAYYGVLRVKWKKLFLNLALAFGVFALLIIVIKPLVRFQDHFTDLYRDLRVSDILEHSVNTTVFRPGDAIPPPPDLSLHLLKRVLQSHVLRVGYYFMDTPFCYFNSYGELSGYDVSFAYQLAKDLDCALQFIPIEPERIGQQLANGDFDIAMSAIVVTEGRLTEMNFVKPYIEQNNVLIVPLSNKNKFLKLEELVERKDLKIGGEGAYYNSIGVHFPFAKPVYLQSFKDLEDCKVDAVLWCYLSAFVWCLNHPEFTIIDYQGNLGKHFFSYAVAQGSDDWRSFLQNWLSLKDESGFTQTMYDYWILGHPPETEQKRWSILSLFTKRH